MLSPGELLRCRYELCPGQQPAMGDIVILCSIVRDDASLSLTSVQLVGRSEVMCYDISDASLCALVGDRDEYLERLA